MSIDEHSMNPTPPISEHDRGRFVKIAAGLLLLLQAGLLAWGATQQSPMMDEMSHLAAGLSHWSLGRFEAYAVNPPLVRLVATLPVVAARPSLDWKGSGAGAGWRPEYELNADFVAANGPRSFQLLKLARWGCIPFALLGGFICFRWASDLYGPRGGLLALALWCFCPNVLAHGQILEADLGAASVGVAACYSFWRWLRSRLRADAAAAGIVLGLAELTKSTWIALFALWPLLLFLWDGVGHRDRPPSAARRACPLGLILLIGVLVVHLGYGFEGSFARLGDFDFRSEALGGPFRDPANPDPHNRFAGHWSGAIPIPFPRDYLLGIDSQRSDLEAKLPSYLRGEWRNGGWWYYYLYALLIKVPLGTWALIVLATLLRWFRGGSRGGRRDDVALLAAPVAVIALVSSQTGFNHHLRYVLPAFPFVFIWAGGAARVINRREWPLGAVAVAALTWSVGSSLWVYPHNLSYFNELVGGPTGGPRHLLDSNVDWGQDLFYLKRWLDEHPEARPLGLAYFGPVDPRLAGIDFTPPPRGPTPGEVHTAYDQRLGPHPGWFAVSVNLLHGMSFGAPDGRGGTVTTGRSTYTYFQRFRPVALAGYSIYIYHINSNEANRVRSELGLDEYRGLPSSPAPST